MIVTYLTSCKEEHAHFNAVVLFFVLFFGVCVFRLKKKVFVVVWNQCVATFERLAWKNVRAAK